MRETIVVGCGVSGLSCAIRLAEAGFTVRILARERTPNTTSDIAAAVWYPFRCGSADRGLAWSRRTFRVLRELSHDRATGVSLVEGIDLLPDDDAATPWWKDAVEHFRAAHRVEIPDGSPAAWVFEAPVVAMPVYMRWLEAKAASLGIAIETRTVESLDAVLEECPVVVDCAGLGARELTGDPTLVPIRGQVVRVEPGHVRRFVQAGGGDELAYIIPRPDCTVLGGTQDVGVWDTAVDAAEFVSALDDVMLARFNVKPSISGNVRRYSASKRTIEISSRDIGGRPVVFYVDVPAGSSTSVLDLGKVQVTAR